MSVYNDYASKEAFAASFTPAYLEHRASRLQADGVSSAELVELLWSAWQHGVAWAVENPGAATAGVDDSDA